MLNQSTVYNPPWAFLVVIKVSDVLFLNPVSEVIEDELVYSAK